MNYNVYDLCSDYSRDLKARALPLPQAKQLCRDDEARKFWPKNNGEIVAANEHDEAIHVLVPVQS